MFVKGFWGVYDQNEQSLLLLPRMNPAPPTILHTPGASRQPGHHDQESDGGEAPGKFCLYKLPGSCGKANKVFRGGSVNSTMALGTTAVSGFPM